MTILNRNLNTSYISTYTFQTSKFLTFAVIQLATNDLSLLNLDPNKSPISPGPQLSILEKSLPVPNGKTPNTNYSSLNPPFFKMFNTHPTVPSPPHIMTLNLFF